MTTCPAMWRSIITMATPTRSSAAFAAAAHVTRLNLVNSRVVVDRDGAARRARIL